MENLREKILEAAVRAFMRFGVNRTRMHDIASEAGVARQTVYSNYKNKNEILCASIRHFSDQSLAAVQKEWSALETLEDKLSAYYKHSIIPSFKVITASPDARDMIGGFNAEGKAATLEAQATNITACAEMLAHYSFQGHSAEQLAEYLVLSSLGIRDHARDETQLLTLLNTQKAGLLALLT
ncbi:TetR/AcrR family transcriptional regulator [Pseudovibrio sp. Alg231-02]|uniref:TetR/AcrR family transcriptional regulator n=1 Tax=Pseudovibrio sp. Alg231-02 TaxID=1922223 RepID=UPI000D5542FD|nr:TetR family transcriptional regulator [Pseudovibrio sp. Alg231-02]